MKTFIPLENNPTVLTALAHELGLSEQLSFHDVLSLTDKDILSLLPRPVYALLFIFPITAISERFYEGEMATETEYTGSGDEEPVLWFKQTIQHACGLIGTLHCITNGPAAAHIRPASHLDRLVREAIPLKPTERAQLVHDSAELEAAHANAAASGDSIAPALGVDPGCGFIAFVKGNDGHLWELEGRRKGPLDRGLLGKDDDMLSDSALRMGPFAFLKREEDAGMGELRFSCVVLGPSMD